MRSWPGLILFTTCILGQPSPVQIPAETAGVQQIAEVLVSTFDQADVVMLGEAHRRKLDSDLRIAVVRHPDFAKKVGAIVVEFASTTHQPVLDRYIRGEQVDIAEWKRIWTSTTQGANEIWDDPMYAEFFTAVRDINASLPPAAQIRVFGGDPGPGDNRGRETAAVAVLKGQALRKTGKALMIYGAAHFYKSLPKSYLESMGEDIGIANRLRPEYPDRTFVVIPVGGLTRPPPVKTDKEPEYRKFDQALKTAQRPVLLPLQRPPFRDFMAEEFLGRSLTTCRGPGGCGSVFRSSTITLGQIADACVYVGGGMP